MGLYFDSRYEQESIDAGIAARQIETGVEVAWWLWDPQASRVNNIYDEDDGSASREWKGPIRIPVYSATRTEGPLQDTGEGGYTVDSVMMVLGYRQATDAGLLPPVDEAKDVHLKDRFVWDGNVWSPSSIVARNLLGHGGTRATILISATQVRDDELINDAQFQRYAETDYVEPDSGHVAG